MKMFIIGLYDRKAQAFVEMSAVPSLAVAQRSLAEAVNAKDSQHAVAKWPGDFELYELGEWDPETGRVTPRENEACEYEKRLIVHCDNLKIS